MTHTDGHEGVARQGNGIMDHPDIDEHNVAERYVAGRLSEEEAALFEEHYLDCQACIDRVEDAERLQRGLRRVAEQETVKAVQLGIVARLAAWSRSRQAGLVLPLLLLIAVLPAGLQYRQLRQVRQDLDQAKSELAAAFRPQANTEIFLLSPFRGGGPLDPGPVNQISLSAEPEWIVLSLEPSDEHPAYRATLIRDEQTEVWQASDLVLDPQGTVVVSFHSTFLSPDEYQLRLEGLPADGEPVPAGRFPLRVIIRR